MSKFKQRKYLERFADGGLIRAMKNREKILADAEKNALTPSAPTPASMAAAASAPTMPIGPVNQMVTQQALKVKQDADAATKSLGLRGMADGGAVPSPYLDYKKEEEEKNKRSAALEQHLGDTRRIRRASLTPSGLAGAALGTAKMLSRAAGGPSPLTASVSAALHAGDAGAASTPITDYLGAESSRRQLAQYPDQVSRGLRGYAGGGEIDFGQGSAMHGGFGRDSSVPLSSSVVAPKPWAGPPRLERMGSTRDLISAADYGGAVRTAPMGGTAPVTNSMGRTQLSQNSPANMSYSKPPTTTSMPTIGGPAATPAAAAPAGTTSAADYANPATKDFKLGSVDNSAKDFKWNPAQRSFDPSKPPPTVGETIGTGFGKVPLSAKTGYPMMGDGGEVMKARWGGPTEDNESTRVHSPIYKGLGGKWDGMPMFADGGSIPADANAVRLARANKVKGDMTTATLAEIGRKGSEYLVKKGLPHLAEMVTATGEKAVPGVLRFVPPAAGIVGSARSIAQSPEERAAFAQSVGLGDTPLGASGADAWRTMANVGNAVTGGLADYAGRQGADLYAKAERGMPAGPMPQYAFADGGTVNPLKGKKAYAGDEAKIQATLDKVPEGYIKGMLTKRAYADDAKKIEPMVTGLRNKLGYADGGAVPHGRVTKDYFEEVDQQMGNGGGVDEGEIYGEGGPTDDKQPIMASPGEFVVPADVARKNKKKLRKMVEDGHTPVHKQGLRNGFMSGGLVDQFGNPIRYADDVAPRIAQRTLEQAAPQVQTAGDKLLNAGKGFWEHGTKQARDVAKQMRGMDRAGLRRQAGEALGRGSRFARRTLGQAAPQVRSAVQTAQQAVQPAVQAVQEAIPQARSGLRGAWDWAKGLVGRGAQAAQTAAQPAVEAVQGAAQSAAQAAQQARDALASGTRPAPNLGNYERFIDPKTGQQIVQEGKPLAKPSSIWGSRPAPNARPLRPPVDIDPTRAFDPSKVRQPIKGETVLGEGARVGPKGEIITPAKPPKPTIGQKVKGAAQWAKPLALGATAYQAWNTDTEDYRKRFALDEKNPEGTPYGLRWMAKPGLGSDIAVRALGAASDLGDVMTSIIPGVRGAGRFYRDNEQAPAPAKSEAAPPGLGFSQDPGPKDSSQRANQGIPIPARTGLRTGEDLPAFDAQGRPIDATELAPIPGGGFISGGGRLKKYEKDAMPLPSGVTDTSTPEEKAADKARRADWTAQSQAIDDKNALAQETENRRIDDMVSRNAMNSAAYNRREGLRNRNVGQYMGGLGDQEMAEQSAQRRALSDVATQNRAAEMARAKMSAEAQKYNTDTVAATSRYGTDVGILKTIMDNARLSGQATLAQRKENMTETDQYVAKKLEVIDPTTKKPDPLATQQQQQQYDQFVRSPMINNPKFLAQFKKPDGSAVTSVNDIPREQVEPLLQRFFTAQAQVKDLPVDKGDTPLEGMPTDFGLRKMKVGDALNWRSDPDRNAINIAESLWGASGRWNPFVSPEAQRVLTTGTQGSQAHNTALSASHYDTPTKRMQLIRDFEARGKQAEANDLRSIWFPRGTR